jgi:ubiquinone/menaquinone biosynthesis C-methylase UbiE
MSDSFLGPLRLFDAATTVSMRGVAPPPTEALVGYPSSLEQLGELLARQEILRGPLSQSDPIEPLSLQWYLHLEQVRHNRQGRWLPRHLEFGKHQGESLLGLGIGLGSDLIQYARFGANVTAVCSSSDQLALVRRNFELRGLSASFVHAMPHALPLESASIDVVCLTGFIHTTNDAEGVVEEVYRILRPGGKVLAVVPAHYDIHYWARLLFVARSRAREEAVPPSVTGLLTSEGRRFKRGELRKLFHRFQETRIAKRHLRRSDVPPVWRWLPLSLLERLAGRLLVFKGFKPVSAVRGEQLAA